MSQLVEALYPVPDLRRTPLSSLRWWESRRLLFNKVVGSAGLVTLAGVSLLFSLPPALAEGPNLVGLAVGAMVYGIAANACYTLGWFAEQLARAVWGREAPEVGPLLFRQGLIFSVGLTLLPLLLASVLWVARVIAAVVG
jgi:hypothetical protein